MNFDIFSANDLGHQLIDEAKECVTIFLWGKKEQFVLYQVQIWPGKALFCGPLPVNYILGMTGAPVCATEMKFIPGKLFTSMRTMDSLSDNESYFYAELRRLNMLKSKIEEGEPVFFILDEILKGTNSADKSTGSKLFLQRID